LENPRTGPKTIIYTAYVVRLGMLASTGSVGHEPEVGLWQSYEIKLKELANWRRVSDDEPERLEQEWISREQISQWVADVNVVALGDL
jgi:hypothetical protein